MWHRQPLGTIRHVQGYARGDLAIASCNANERLITCYGAAYTTDGSRVGLDALFPYGPNGCEASGSTTNDDVYVVAACLTQ